MGRKAFGPSKKKACDTHHCKKSKKSASAKTGERTKIHLIDNRGI